MGTRINVLLPHQLADWSDRDETLRSLDETLLAARELEAYWAKEDLSNAVEANIWIAKPPHPPPFSTKFYRYSGPGPLFVEVNPFVVHICTGGR